MDQLQAEWARRLFGCASELRIRWDLMRAHFGWPLRLSSLVWESAIMAYARLQVMPLDHAGARMLLLASSTHATTWASAVRAFMSGAALATAILPLDGHPLFSHEELLAARSSSTDRRATLRRYRTHVVRPALRERDDLRFQESAAKLVPTLNVPFSSLMPAMPTSDDGMLDFDFGSSTWAMYRTWSIVRLTGNWPTTCFGGTSLQASLDVCPFCSEHDISTLHCLCFCPGTAAHLHLLGGALPCRRENVSEVIAALFGPCADPSLRYSHIGFVGACVHAALTAQPPSASISVPAHVDNADL